MATKPSLLQSVQHIVVLMLENRSFDHMLGFLYTANGNKSPLGQPFDGLTGNESNVDDAGNQVPVFKIKKSMSDAYYMPGADPGEGYMATNSQLFDSTTAPSDPVALNNGFVKDFQYTLGWETPQPSWGVLPGTVDTNIMGMFTPEMLPVLSTLAREYAVCDHWYASAPTETMPNRAFASAATSQGHMDDKTKTFTCPSIFGLSQNQVSWMMYGYDEPPLTRQNFPDTVSAPDSNFGLFTDFQTAAANGTLAAYSFLEPDWSSTGNSQHPNYDVALGEQFIHDVYYALRSGKAWNDTLLIITYDEHGGCYDHVPPPQGATPPDNSIGEYGFNFERFGVRVPAVLVSPRIAAGTVFNVPAGSMPIDHTSILKTVETRWNLPPLTKRDATAPHLGAALTLAQPRTDDALKGVRVPSATAKDPLKGLPTHLQKVHAELVSHLPVRRGSGAPPTLKTSADYKQYITSRTEAWKAARAAQQPQPVAAAAGTPKLSIKAKGKAKTKAAAKKEKTRPRAR
jgi:phospholipase C